MVQTMVEAWPSSGTAAVGVLEEPWIVHRTGLGERFVDCHWLVD